jgi:hypothetical protein
LGANGSKNVKTLLILRSVAVSVIVITVPFKGQTKRRRTVTSMSFAEITPVRFAKARSTKCEMAQVGNGDGAACSRLGPTKVQGGHGGVTGVS